MFDETYQNGPVSDRRSLPNPDRNQLHLRKPPIEPHRASRASRPKAHHIFQASPCISSYLSIGIGKF